MNRIVLIIGGIGLFTSGIIFGLTLNTIMQETPRATIEAVEGINDSYRIWMKVTGVPNNTNGTFIIHADMKDILNAIDKFKDE